MLLRPTPQFWQLRAGTNSPQEVSDHKDQVALVACQVVHHREKDLEAAALLDDLAAVHLLAVQVAVHEPQKEVWALQNVVQGRTQVLGVQVAVHTDMVLGGSQDVLAWVGTDGAAAAAAARVLQEGVGRLLQVADEVLLVLLLVELVVLLLVQELWPLLVVLTRLVRGSCRIPQECKLADLSTQCLRLTIYATEISADAEQKNVQLLQ